MTVIILLSGAIYPMFKGTLLSFKSFSLANVVQSTPSIEYFLNMFKSLFLSSILLSSPFIFLNLLIMTVLGILAKTVPQLNVLMVSFVVNIAIGLLVFTTNIQEFFQVGFKIYSEHLAEWFHLMGRV
jgi:flagellar biosynthetic protein FliR